jgi:Fic family protein
LSTLIRHPDLLISFYIRKEAVLSSQIEGTQSTLTELLLFEIEPETGTEDTVEVANYAQAMRHGLSRLSSGFPLSLRFNPRDARGASSFRPREPIHTWRV